MTCSSDGRSHDVGPAAAAEPASASAPASPVMALGGSGFGVDEAAAAAAAATASRAKSAPLSAVAPPTTPATHEDAAAECATAPPRALVAAPTATASLANSASPSTPPPRLHLAADTAGPSGTAKDEEEATTNTDAVDQTAQPDASAIQEQTVPTSASPAAPYTPAPMARFDQAYAMMATLASIAGAGAPVGMTPPPTVTPAQVTLPSYSAEDEFGALGHANGLRQPNADPSLESFARVEFADSVFQMTTYAVIIGRDQGALMQARRDERQAEEHRRRTQENALQGLPPPSPIHRERSKFSKSYVSEEGGMLGPESDSEDTGNARPSKRRKPSTTGSSQNDKDEALDKMIFNRQYVSHTPGAAAVDLRSLRPSPWHVPFIGIHSPGPNIASKTKAISREHLKIVYNQAQGVFEAIPLHKNGFFCQDVHYNTDKVVLKCGDRLQIKDIDFRFIINGVERGCTGAEELEEDDGAAANKAHTHGGKEMSFEFEGSHGNGAIQDTSDELSELEASPPELSDFEGLANGNDEDEDEEMDDAVEQKAKTGAEAGGKEHGQAVLEQAQRMPAGLPDAPMPYQARKRGPGRPPKNGFMSKREQRLLKKAQLEMEKMKVPQTPAEQPVKRKVGRPRKHPLPDQGGERPEKRRYKPRKPKGEEGAQGASDGERRAKDKKDRRARPKSPALDLKIEDYSEEQLQKPNKNYGVLIDETLTAAGPDGLTLKQIYKRICQRYPWFFFHTETKGWESSVRHNLIGNEAFKKDETTNLWARVPGVELDAGKKRKASTPDRALAAQAYGPYSYQYNGAAPHLPLSAAGAMAAYPLAPPAYHGTTYVPQQQPYGSAASPPVPQAMAHVGPPPPVAGCGPLPAPARPLAGQALPGTYSSPYASRPLFPHASTVKPEQAAAAPPPPPPAQPLAASASASASSPAGALPTIRAAMLNQLGPVPRLTKVWGRPLLEPRLVATLAGLQTGLIDNLAKAKNPRAQAIVSSALHRCLGLETGPQVNERMEAICLRGLRQVAEAYIKTSRGAAAAAAMPQGDVLGLLDPWILATFAGFCDVCAKALGQRFGGEAQARRLAVVAVARVLGFAAAGGGQDGEQRLVEEQLMNAIWRILASLNDKLKPPR